MSALTSKSVQGWWPVIVGFSLLVLAGGEARYRIEDQAGRLLAIEKMITPDRIRERVRWETNIERDIIELRAEQKILAQRSQSLDCILDDRMHFVCMPVLGGGR